MKRKQHITAFYLETLLMIVVFISIILVLTRVFGSARVQSVEAKQLTSAVTLAQNTAEAVSASRSPEELLQILNEEGNARIRKAGAQTGKNPGEKPGETFVERPGKNPGEKPGNNTGEEVGEIPGEEPGNNTGEEAGGEVTIITALYDVDMHPVKIPDALDDSAQLRTTQGGNLLLVETSWSPAQEEDRSGLADVSIRVSSGNSGKPLYTLNTAVYTGE